MTGNCKSTWGARPPRAQFFAPSRKTSCALKFPKRSHPCRAHEAVREGAHRDARGGRAPQPFELPGTRAIRCAVNFFEASELPDGLPSATRRYSRLQICTTP